MKFDLRELNSINEIEWYCQIFEIIPMIMAIN